MTENEEMMKREGWVGIKGCWLGMGDGEDGTGGRDREMLVWEWEMVRMELAVEIGRCWFGIGDGWVGTQRCWFGMEGCGVGTRIPAPSCRLLPILLSYT